ncbi:MAG: O-antigen ligase family protein [Actinomycetia bacterium]|nr:O-antigen ligase family protein [Actinomycetes bacterium]
MSLTLVWFACLLAPASLKPLVAVLAALVAGALVLVVQTLVPGISVGTEARAVLAAAGLGLAALLAGALTGYAPLVSILGVVGQHNGWLLWAVAALWFAVGTRLARGRQFRATVWTVAIMGSAAGVFGLLDAAHVVESVRYSPEVAGLMDSSISLGQVLVLGLGATSALVLMERVRSVRVVAGLMAVVEVLALVASNARSAEIAFVAGVWVALLWTLGSRLDHRVRHTLWGLTAVVLLAAVVGVFVIAALGPVGTNGLGIILTDRPAIWHSAWARVPSHLLLGEGPDRFTAVVAWGPLNNWIQWQTTNSPHNVLLDWLLGGGVVALGAFVAALLLSGQGIARRLASSRPGPKLLALGVGAWAVSLLTSWTDPLSAITAALVIGALLCGEKDSRPPTPARIASTAVITIAAVALLVAGAPLMALERGWANDQRVGGSSLTPLEARWERWPDPAFGGDALRASLAELPSSAQTAGRIASEVLERTSWDTNGAIGSIQVAVALDAISPSTPHPSVERALAAGRAADPATALWDRAQSIIEAR